MTHHARFVGGERGGMTSNCFLKNKNFHTGAHLMAEGEGTFGSIHGVGFEHREK